MNCISYQTFFPFYGPVYQFGINYFTVYGSILCSSTVKLKRGGRGAPFGKVVVYSRNSSKYGSRRDDRGVGLALGSY
jgi:hypothetical protein